MRGAVALCFVAACFSKPDAPSATTSDGAVSGDAVAVDTVDGFVQPPDCAGVFFPMAPTESIADLGSAFVSEPTMTDDELEIYFTTDPDPNGTPYRYNIQRAYRAATGQSFTVDTTALALNSTAVEQDASITADGLLIVFVSTRTGSERAYYATRATRTSPWTDATLVDPEIETSTLDLSPDGLVLYFVDASTPRHLRVATRGSRTDPFVLSPAQLGDDRFFPAVSADQRELYFNTTNSTISRAERPSTAVPFGSGTVSMTAAFDPDLSADGQTLIATSAAGGNVYVYRRACP